MKQNNNINYVIKNSFHFENGIDIKSLLQWFGNWIQS